MGFEGKGGGKRGFRGQKFDSAREGDFSRGKRRLIIVTLTKKRGE